jgi:oxygen-dependent protoporphyrinogen oxidase
VLGIADAPHMTHVARWRNAGAQHIVGHLARMDALERRLAAHPGLFVVGSGFRSIGIPDCVADARATASAVAASVGERR